jgi:hypothetical protein
MRLANLGGRTTLIAPGGDDRGVDITDVSGGKFGPLLPGETLETWVEGIGTMRTRFAAPAGDHHAG